MKKIIFICTLFVFCLFGCGVDQPSTCNYNSKVYSIPIDRFSRNYYIFELDGCEFIDSYVGNDLMHKPNCKFCEQRKCLK